MANTPVFFTSLVATSVRLFNSLEQTFCLSSNLSANALAMLPFVMARAAALVVAFIGLLVFGNIWESRPHRLLSKQQEA